MRKLYSAIVFLLISAFAMSQNRLTITITGIRGNIGNIYLQLMNENEEHIYNVVKSVENNRCKFQFMDLKDGKYAYKFFHDSNVNGEFDKNWMGMPTEGFGFSNNAKSNFGAPRFELTVFELNKNTRLESELIYLGD